MTLLLAVFVASGVGFAAGRAGAGPTAGAEIHVAEPVTGVYVVQRGDTVWSIAARLAGPDGDPRPVVDRLIALNHLSGAVIVAGDRLALP